MKKRMVSSDEMETFLEEGRGLAAVPIDAEDFFDTPWTGGTRQFLEQGKIIAQKHFLDDGEIPAMFFLLARQDDKFKVAFIPCGWNDGEEKAMVLDLVRHIIDDAPVGPVLAYCYIAEA